MLGSVVTGYFVELLTLFGIVFVHEVGHVIVARSYGWTVREVKLLPFGGVAEVEDAGGLPSKEEAVVAIAGPLQNVWMGALAWLAGWLGIWDQEWAMYVVQANVTIGLFNLLPIMPLDGGKLLQAALSLSLPYHHALRWGARISILLSAGMLIYAILPVVQGKEEGIWLNLLMLGLFLLLTNWTYYKNIPFLFLRFLTNRSEASARQIAKGVWALPIVITKRHTVVDSLRLFKRDRYHLVIIMEKQGKVLAVIPEQRLVQGYLEEGKPNRAVYELFM